MLTEVDPNLPVERRASPPGWTGEAPRPSTGGFRANAKMRFSDKVMLVAGGTGGLGRAVSLAFLEEGAKVVVTYRQQKEFDALKSEAGANGPAIEGHGVDVTDETAVRQLLAKVLAEHGRLDALVNAVGAYAGGVNLWDLETKVFDQMLALNLRSV